MVAVAYPGGVVYATQLVAGSETLFNLVGMIYAMVSIAVVGYFV